MESYKQYIPKNCQLLSMERKGKKTRLYLKLKCDVHGEFSVRSDALKETGCKKCTRDKVKKSYDEQWKKDCTEIHSGKYDYSETEVGNVLVKSTIRCKKHGYFEQTPASHKAGRNCPKCGRIKQIKSKLKGVDSIDKKYKELGKNYDLSEVVYKGVKEKVKITCDENHVFYTTPNEIFNANRCCTVCSKGRQRSKAEVELYDFINSHVYCESSNRKILNGLELDIYIPSAKLAIEYNGLYWHSEKMGKTSHFDKKNKCIDKGLDLIHIYEDDWTNRKSAVKSKLLNYLHMIKEDIVPLSLGNFTVQEGGEEANILLLKNRIDKEIQYTNIFKLIYCGFTIGVAAYSKYEDTIIIKQTVNVEGFEQFDVNRAFVQYFKNYEEDVYFSSSIDWLDERYIIKYVGKNNRHSIIKPITRYVKGLETYKHKIDEENTIKKSGYVISKI